MNANGSDFSAAWWNFLEECVIEMDGCPNVQSKTMAEEQPETVKSDMVELVAQATGAVEQTRTANDVQTVRPEGLSLDEKSKIIEEVLAPHLPPPIASQVVAQCKRRLGLSDRNEIDLRELAKLQQEVESALSRSIGAVAARHAFQSAKVFSRSEAEQLTKIYAKTLIELNLTPDELQKKVDLQTERATMFMQHARMLERNVGRLRDQVAKRKLAEAELARHRDRLEEMVAERTAELQQANEKLVREIAERRRAEEERTRLQDELVKLSRHAGMAEVAVGVLHNVGNVLNSVNVSGNLIENTLQETKIERLADIVALINVHLDDLGTFFTQDQRGMLIPRYLEQVAELLGNMKGELLTETKQLVKNIEHIKQIVAMQQNHAKNSGLTEIVAVGRIIEDACRIFASALEHLQIQLAVSVDGVGEIAVDRHSVMQILVNLISNAKHALGEVEGRERRLTICCAATSSTIKIAVADNGVGIPQEHLVEIFHHGFTTREDGHGFGLHSSATAAQEMGGRLFVHSDGPGQGAVFTLELPKEIEGIHDHGHHLGLAR